MGVGFPRKARDSKGLLRSDSSSAGTYSELEEPPGHAALPFQRWVARHLHSVVGDSTWLGCLVLQLRLGFTPQPHLPAQRSLPMPRDHSLSVW